MYLDAAADLTLMTITSVSPRGSGPTAPTATPGTIGAFLLLVLLVLIVFSGVLILIRLDLLPERMRPAMTKAQRPGPEAVCHKCGYDLRASPSRCPECGEPRRMAGSLSIAGPASRVLRRVTFQAGKDVLEIPLWRELTPCIENLSAADSQNAERLFAGPERSARVMTAEQLRDAAEQLLKLVHGLPVTSAHGPTVSLLNRVRQFARSHSYARVIRTVHCTSQNQPV